MKEKSELLKTAQSILFVEGAGDQVSFFEEFFQFLKIKTISINDEIKDKTKRGIVVEMQGVLVLALGGVTEIDKRLYDYISQIQDINFINKIAVIRDVEKENPKEVFSGLKQSIKKAIQNNLGGTEFDERKFPLPTKANKWSTSGLIGTFLLPNCEGVGCLETLCLKSIENNIEMQACVNPFIHAVDNLMVNKKSTWKHKEKKILQAYLASKGDLKFASTPGAAAQKQYWDFNHSIFQELAKFLEGFKNK